jgi:hypothetical protein
MLYYSGSASSRTAGPAARSSSASDGDVAQKGGVFRELRPVDEGQSLGALMPLGDDQGGDLDDLAVTSCGAPHLLVRGGEKAVGLGAVARVRGDDREDGVFDRIHVATMR